MFVVDAMIQWEFGGINIVYMRTNEYFWGNGDWVEMQELVDNIGDWRLVLVSDWTNEADDEFWEWTRSSLTSLGIIT